MIRLLLATLFALTLVGCNNDTPTTQITPQRLAQIKTIAIVTGFDNRVEFKDIAGINTSTQRSRVEWPLDAYVQSAVTALLKDHYTIKEIAYSTATVYQEATAGNILWGGAPEAGPRVRKVIPAGAVDAIVFIAPKLSDTGNGALVAKPLEGVGYYTKDGLFSSQNWLYISYQITLVDGGSFQSLDYATGGSPGDSPFKLTAMPYRDVKGWPLADVGYIGLSPAQRDEFRRLTYAMFDATLPDTLRRLGLR